MPSVGIVGGRGYVAEELLRQLADHPSIEVACVASGSLEGQRVQDQFPQLPYPDLRFVAPRPASLAPQPVDLWVLALSNGEAPPLVAELEKESGRSLKFIDIGADFRCDPAWQYGLTEIFSEQIQRASRVANPGCYATGIQLALWPVRQWLRGAAVAFGVSGYSGAGRTPSPRNDPQRLADNLLPYQMVGHQHEREVTQHLGHPVRLLPHVAPFFRGISLTIRFGLTDPWSLEGLQAEYAALYRAATCVQFVEEPPEIAEVRDTPHCRIGGLVRDSEGENHWVVVSALDNLAKGAATQAIQNANLMLGRTHDEGLRRG